MKNYIALIVMIILTSCLNNNHRSSSKPYLYDNNDLYVIGVQRMCVSITKGLGYYGGHSEYYYYYNYYLGKSITSEDTVLIISGYNKKSKVLQKQEYKIGDKFKLLKQNN